MSLAVWINILGLPHGGETRGGIISTRANSIKYGTQIYSTKYSIANYILTAPGNTEYEVFNYYPTGYPTGWYHVVLTLDTAAGEMMMYENGLYKESHDSLTVSGTTYSQGTNTVWFGRESTTYDQYYGNNQIDEFMVFDYILSSSDIIALSSI